MSDLAHRRFRAPQEDDAALVDPPLKRVSEVFKANRSRASSRDYELQGLSLDQLTEAARGELLAKALDYTGAYHDVGFAKGVPSTAGFVLSGHQPELFHPGVWFKNFLLSSIAERVGGVAINLIGDSDTVRSTAIRVPVKHGDQAIVESVAFDAPDEAVPFEERPILDRPLFESFAERALATYQSGGPASPERDCLLVEPVWKAAKRLAADKRDRARLGLVLAQARHQLEAHLGLETLEISLSSVAQTSTFRWFVVHLLAQLPRLRKVYNAALAEYRLVNRIRSSTHPVPALAADDDWLEAPLLVWTKNDPRRRHVFARQQGDVLVLTDRQNVRLILPVSASGSAEKAVDALAAAEARGIKLRPRALVTTMYARLVLSDLFIHGIGGAKYDELTDLIIRRFFGIEPPTYVTATATFRLPIDRPAVSEDDARAISRRIRDSRYHPETLLAQRLVASDARLRGQLEGLAAEKREYLAKHDLRRCPPEVFDQLDKLNRAMHALLQPVDAHLRADHARITERHKQSQLLGSREFSFVLFPAEKLAARLLDLSKHSS
jgi:hypothetical protein